MQKSQVITPQAQSEEVENLKKRIKELEAQLRQAEIKAEFYDEMINVAEAKLKIPIRKKAGDKQQMTCTQRSLDAIISGDFADWLA